MSRATFTVDTQLFRELGDLLVGRDSTALAELIKNAYDADARVVIVSGAKLGDAENGRIQIVDDGVGMTAEQFHAGFLTIAGRGKTLGDRKSAVLGRVFTGEKGVGRLAARKLARRIVVESWAYNGETAEDGSLLAHKRGIKALIDWDAIEKLKTLDQLSESSAVAIDAVEASAKQPKAGTSITLGPLRRSWSNKDKNDFLVALAGLAPAPQLVAPLPSGFGGKLLFDESRSGIRGRAGRRIFRG
jgi:hypothetical protein